MKKAVKIILVIVVLILCGGAYYAYSIYKIVAGNETLAGIQENIPTEVAKSLGVSKGTDDWSHWKGADLDGKSKTTGIVTDWSKGLEKVWHADFLCQDQGTGSWSSPVIQGNSLIVPGRDKKNDLVFCLNANTGELIWKGTLAGSMGNKPRS